MASAPHILVLAAGTVVRGKFNPFSPGNVIYGEGVAGAPTLYKQNKAPSTAPFLANTPGVGFKNGVPVYARIVADGVASTFHADDYPALANLHNDAGALTNANNLRIVVTVNGNVFQRKQSDVALTGGDFRAVNNTGMQLEIQKTGGGALGAGSIIEVHMDPDGEHITSDTLVANSPREIKSADFFLATGAAIVFADRI